MDSGCFAGTTHVYKRLWFKSTVILLFLAIVTTVTIVGSTRIFLRKDHEKDLKNSESVISQNEADHASQNVPIPSEESEKYGSESEAEDEGLEEERNLISERADGDNGRGVREVKDLPLMIVKHKVSHPSRKSCSEGLNILEMEAVKRLHSRKAFLYQQKLYEALAAWTGIADELGDPSLVQWAIRAYSPVLRSGRSVVFQKNSDNSCKVTHRELVVGHKCKDDSSIQGRITVNINGQPKNRSEGTFSIHKTAVFDLSTETDVSNLNVSVRNYNCFTSAHLSYSMLFEFCSINKTMQIRFMQTNFPLTPNQPEADKQQSEKESSGTSSKQKESCGDQSVTSDMGSKQKEGSGDQNRTSDTGSSGDQSVTSDTGSKQRESSGDQNRTSDTGSSGDQSVTSDMGSKQKEGSGDQNRTSDTGSSGDQSVTSDTGSKQRESSGDQIRTSVMLNDTRTFQEASDDWVMENVPLLAERMRKQAKAHSLLEKLASTSKPGTVLSQKSTSPAPPKSETGRVERDTSSQQRTRSPDKTCVRQKLMVDLFEDLHYPILMPARPVDVGMCTGTCIHACHMGQAGENITAHAVLLNKLAGSGNARFAHVWGNGLRKSECVPHHMKTMSVLRMTLDPRDSYRTEILNWPNMVISSCRCA